MLNNSCERKMLHLLDWKITCERKKKLKKKRRRKHKNKMYERKWLKKIKLINSLNFPVGWFTKGHLLSSDCFPPPLFSITNRKMAKLKSNIFIFNVHFLSAFFFFFQFGLRRACINLKQTNVCECESVIHGSLASYFLTDHLNEWIYHVNENEKPTSGREGNYHAFHSKIKLR